MAIEMALIQKFGLLLGHPNLALSVVLSSLLLATGLGSLLSEPIVRRLGGRPRFVSYALAFVLLAELLVVFPRLPEASSLPLVARVALVAALVMPVGLLLGTYFPTGLERLKGSAARPRPLGLGPQRHGLGGGTDPGRRDLDDGGDLDAVPGQPPGQPSRRIHRAEAASGRERVARGAIWACP
jgi:hypothetical protein